MRFWLFVNVIFLPLLAARGQNLVPNGSFESPGICTTDKGQIYLASPWTEPISATADWFTTCGVEDWSVPSNDYGVQDPLHGESYAGIRCYATWGVNQREFITSPLSQALDSGVSYNVSYWVSLADGNQVKYAVDRIGLHFSESPLGFADVSAFDLEPHISSPKGQVIDDRENWVRVSGCYVADGTENYLIIGNLYPDDSLTIREVSAATWAQSSYYYVDSVVVEPQIENIDVVPREDYFCDEAEIDFDLPWPTDSLFVNGNEVELPLLLDSTDTLIVQAYGNSCQIQDTITVQVFPSPSVKSVLDTILCDSATWIVDLSVYDSVFWSNGDQAFVKTIESDSPIEVEVYRNGCTAEAQFESSLEQTPVLDIQRWDTLCGSEVIKLELNQDWNLTLDGLNVASPIEIDGGGDYSVVASNYCGFSTDTLSVFAISGEGFVLPNIITPNGDGKNECFEMPIDQTCPWKLEVYNRWGSRVFRDDRASPCWDPRDLSPATYYYWLSGPSEYQGWIKLVR